MRKIIFCLIIGGLLVIWGKPNLIFAQITLTSKDAPSEPGIYFVMGSSDSVTVNLGEPGANRYWDFTNIPLEEEDHWRVVDFDTSPFAYRFKSLNGNLAYQVTEYVKDTTFITYNYARLTEMELTQLGRGQYQIVGTDTTIKNMIVAKRTKPQLNSSI